MAERILVAALAVLFALLSGCADHTLLAPSYRVQLCAEMPARDVETFTSAAEEWNAALGFDAYLIVADDEGPVDVTVCVVPGFKDLNDGDIGRTWLDEYPIRIEYQPFFAHHVATHELGHVAGIGHLKSGCMKQKDPEHDDVTDVDVDAFRAIWGDLSVEVPRG